MPSSARVSGTWRSAQSYAKVSGTWRFCQVYGKAGGTWRLVSAALAAALSASSAIGSGAAPGAAQTNAVTCTPSGGSGSYSYAWEYVSGDNSITCVSASTANTSWLRSSGTSGSFVAYWRCKVTDTVTGDIVFSANVTVQLTLT